VAPKAWRRKVRISERNGDVLVKDRYVAISIPPKANLLLCIDQNFLYEEHATTHVNLKNIFGIQF
jgi:hypothetical protein